MQGNKPGKVGKQVKNGKVGHSYLTALSPASETQF
jgi:hypothetical protein